MDQTHELLIRLDERHKANTEQLLMIHAEVKKTNGRVTSLETWKAKILGGWAVVVSVSSAIGGLVVFIINHLIK